MRSLIALLLFVVSLPLEAQIKVLTVRTLPLGSARLWSAPRWSPDGKTIYYTASDFGGIWACPGAGGDAVQITADRGSGYGFTISPDGSQIAWRRTLPGALPGERVQEVVVRNLSGGPPSVLASGRSLSLPSFVRSDVVFSVAGEIQGVKPAIQPPGVVSVLGVEDTKIAVVRDGVKSLVDPLGNGSYVWPSLSPDGSKLVAYEMDRGTFVCGADGSHPLRIGRRDAPAWTRDGRWLIYMADRDDGHRIRSSAIAFVSPDGKTEGDLTSASHINGMFPQCSPVADEIAFSTLEGGILVITYAETPR